MKPKNSPQTKSTEELMTEIPDDEIWTYRIEGLQEPQIGTDHTHSAGKKALTIVSLLVAISLSIFFSVRAVHTQTFKYNALEDGTFELAKFSNPGDITSIEIDCADGDASKPITVLHEYAFNCDDKLESVRIGANVQQIDGKTFYSCYKLQTITVDANNENYCDVDGVLFTKDLSKVICYPIDHDQYLRTKSGYDTELSDEDEGFDAYVEKVLKFRFPAETTTVGMLAFNYAEIKTVYLPEGLKAIETMAFFRSTMLENIYTAAADGQYASFPEGLESIGSDAFSYDQALHYIYIPDSVTFIGHHAFWDTVYKANGELAGVTRIYAAPDEDTFKKQVHTGDQWRPQYDYMLFKKSVDVQYAAERNAE